MTNEEILELFKSTQQEKITCPSSKEKLSVSPITTSQLRDVVQAATHNQEFNWGFLSTVRDIIKKNVTGNLEKINELDVIYTIFTLTRNEEAKKQKEAFEKVDTKDKTIEDDTVNITYGIPSFSKLDTWIEDVKGYLFNKENTMEGVVGMVFLLELCKHIKDIKVKGETLTVDVNTVSSLPYKYITPVLKYIEEHKDININCLTSSDTPQGFDVSLFI